MIKYKNILLNEAMKELSNKYLKHFKEDLAVDFDFIRNFKMKKLIWTLRDCGTNIYSYENINAIGSNENTTINYYKDKIKKIYSISIIKIDNGNIYGDITELSKKTFFNNLKKQEKQSKQRDIFIYLKTNIVKAIKNVPIEIDVNKIAYENKIKIADINTILYSNYK